MCVITAFLNQNLMPAVLLKHPLWSLGSQLLRISIWGSDVLDCFLAQNKVCTKQSLLKVGKLVCLLPRKKNAASSQFLNKIKKNKFKKQGRFYWLNTFSWWNCVVYLLEVKEDLKVVQTKLHCSSDNFWLPSGS